MTDKQRLNWIEGGHRVLRMSSRSGNYRVENWDASKRGPWRFNLRDAIDAAMKQRRRK